MGFIALEKVSYWVKTHAGIFSVRDSGVDLWVREIYSQKDLQLKGAAIQQVEEKENMLNPEESYLVILFKTGRQLVLCKQGFAFPPDFTHTGTIPLPNQVYCMRDFYNLFQKLKHMAAEEDRRREALDLVMILIAVLDGGRGVGLDLDPETREVEAILDQLENKRTPPPPHN